MHIFLSKLNHKYIFRVEKCFWLEILFGKTYYSQYFFLKTERTILIAIARIRLAGEGWLNLLV